MQHNYFGSYIIWTENVNQLLITTISKLESLAQMKNDQNLQRDWSKSRPFQFDLTRMDKRKQKNSRCKTPCSGNLELQILLQFLFRAEMKKIASTL